MFSVLKRRKESRRRNLQFHLPTAVALAPQLRLVQSDSSYISLQDVFDEFCNSKGMSREDSIMAFSDRVKQTVDSNITRVSYQSGTGADNQADPRYPQLKSEIMEEIQAKMVPETILSNVSTFPGYNRPALIWVIVHDTVHDDSGESLAHAETIRHPDRFSPLPYFHLLPEQSDAQSIPLQPKDWIDVYDRNLAG